MKAFDNYKLISINKDKLFAADQPGSFFAIFLKRYSALRIMIEQRLEEISEGPVTM